MEQAGPSIGPLFALEGFAFFTEAIFLGIYLYGWSRIPPKAHFVAGLMVAASGVASACFVVTVNAWMNAPSGFELNGNRLTQIDPFAPFLHPVAWHETLHMLLAAFAATGFLVAGIHAFWLLRKPQSRFHRIALTIALTIGGLPALLQPVSGDLMAKSVAVINRPSSPRWRHCSSPGLARFCVGGIPDAATRTVPYALFIPKGLSLLLYGDPRAEVIGLDRVPSIDWPPVAVVHIAFQLMVACGLLMAAWLSGVGGDGGACVHSSKIVGC